MLAGYLPGKFSEETTPVAFQDEWTFYLRKLRWNIYFQLPTKTTKQNRIDGSDHLTAPSWAVLHFFQCFKPSFPQPSAGQRGDVCQSPVPVIASGIHKNLKLLMHWPQQQWSAAYRQSRGPEGAEQRWPSVGTRSGHSEDDKDVIEVSFPDCLKQIGKFLHNGGMDNPSWISSFFLFSPDKHGRCSVPIETISCPLLSISRSPMCTHWFHGAGRYSNTWISKIRGAKFVNLIFEVSEQYYILDLKVYWQRKPQIWRHFHRNPQSAWACLPQWMLLPGTMLVGGRQGKSRMWPQG